MEGYSMIKRAKLLLLLLSFLGVVGITTTAAGQSVSALPLALTPVHVASDFQGDACNGISQLGGSTCSSSSGSISNLMRTVINLLSLIVGFVAIVMVIISGFRFITANGDSSSIASARSALIYALVGLVVAAMAQYIVHFVLGKVGVK
jgi:hypothetical protein